MKLVNTPGWFACSAASIVRCQAARMIAGSSS